MEVGFIGLGAMGRAMARNLAMAGHQVRAWNRSGTSDAPEGTSMAASPSEVFQADAVFTMLSDDHAVREVVLDGNVLDHARVGVVHVVTSTISVALAGEMVIPHAKAGIGYVSAPVFGRPEVAAAGQLNIMAAGKPDAIEKVRPLLDAIGKRTWVIGEDPKQANAAKIAGNMMIAMAIEAMAEAVALTQSNGLAPEVFFDLILNTLFAGRSYETYSAKIATRDHEPGFRMRLGLKDLKLAAAAAQAVGAQLPMLDAVRARMSEAVEAGMGDDDWSAMAAYTLRGNRSPGAPRS